jgi:hypothetical protein
LLFQQMKFTIFCEFVFRDLNWNIIYIMHANGDFKIEILERK